MSEINYLNESGIRTMIRVLTGTLDASRYRYMVLNESFEQEMAEVLTPSETSGNTPSETSGNEQALLIMKLLDMAYMLGQIAYKIDPALRIIAADCYSQLVKVVRLNFSGEGVCSKETLENTAVKFTQVWNLVVSELSFMDADSKREIFPVEPAHIRNAENEMFVHYDGKDREEVRKAAEEIAMRNFKRVTRGYVAKAEMYGRFFKRILDEFNTGKCILDISQSSMNELRLLLSMCPVYYYSIPEFDSTGRQIGSESFEVRDTPEYKAARELFESILACLDGMLSISTKNSFATRDDIARMYSIIAKQRTHAYFRPEVDEHMSKLNDFMTTFYDVYNRLYAEISAAKIAPEKPVDVHIDDASAKKIGKAVKPGKGSASRDWEIETQELAASIFDKYKYTPGVASKKGVKVSRRDVFNYAKNELAALSQPIQTAEEFDSCLKARTNRISAANVKRYLQISKMS